MDYIIDTHVLLWMESDPEKISRKVISILTTGTDNIFISMASIWEIAIKRSLQKLEIAKPTLELITDFQSGYNAEIITVELNDILAVEKLPYLHKDPFDRMIVSQAIERNIPVLSVDSIFDKYIDNRIW